MINVDYKSLKKNFLPFDAFSTGTDLRYRVYSIDPDSGKESLNAYCQGSYICFGSLLSTWSNVRSCRDFLNHRANFHVLAPTKQKNHSWLYTWLSPNELEEFMYTFTNSILNSSLGVTINVAPDSNHIFPAREGYDVVINTSAEIRQIELKAILFWLRNAIKFPYNYLLADAITLKEKYLPEEELYNLLRTVLFCVKSEKRTDAIYGYCENFSYWGELPKKEDFSVALQAFNNINYIYDGGIFPVGSSFLDRNRSNNLRKEIEFREKILNEIPYLGTVTNNQMNYDINLVFNVESRFDLYMKAYEFKKELWK